MQNFTHTLTVLGTVGSIDEANCRFQLTCRSGEVFEVSVSSETAFHVVRNLDEVDRDRVADPQAGLDGPPSGSLFLIRKYVFPNGLLVVQGILQAQEDSRVLEARQVSLLHSERNKYLFEETHWWLTQIARMADRWLDELFGDRRTYEIDDFAALYRTNLNILGLPTDDNTQEMATLSRYVYGLASAYLLTGRERYLLAARAGVQYQRETFRMLSHDGRYCFWAFGKQRQRYGSQLIEFSLNPDDYGTIPLYEQIYALAGLTQYYRITNDGDVLQDIERTINAFNDFYLDTKQANPEFPGHGGYFSHLDYVTMRPDVAKLDNNTAPDGTTRTNRSRKNWNSIGDHIPAYLINLILALDPLPKDRADTTNIEKFLHTCREMLDEVSTIIVEHFPDKNPAIPYVNERFLADWTPDHSWGWQQNRAIVGHNLKIAWNLTRVANYYLFKGETERATPLLERARKLADSMAEVGLDQVRGGCFDAVEREPKNGMPVEFVWGNTKDFWQQEQGILAYLILYGQTGEPEYLRLAREMITFWNLFFLDHDNCGVYFRVTDDGMPVIQGTYANKAGHAVAGYHAYELNYLAHFYTRAYVQADEKSDNEFCLFFRPAKNSGQRSINVLPDFVAPGTVSVSEIRVGGVVRTTVDPHNFQIELGADELGRELSVVFTTHRPAAAKPATINVEAS